jgi:hypothetical protein
MEAYAFALPYPGFGLTATHMCPGSYSALAISFCDHLEFYQQDIVQQHP